KQPVPAPAPVATEPVRRDAAVSDAQWLDAVRQALVAHKPESGPVDAARPQKPESNPFDAAKTQTPMPAVKPVARETPSPAAPGTAPATTVAPALPPPVAIAPPPAQRIDVDHPVPPGSIPETPPTDAAKADEPGRSRIGKWISAIPLLGPVVDNARH